MQYVQREELPYITGVYNASLFLNLMSGLRSGG